MCCNFLITTSCASILTGSKRKVLFESDPSGAKIFVNGFEKGKTPTQIKVAADDRIDFRLDDYRERVVVMDSEYIGLYQRMIELVLVTWIIFCAIAIKNIKPAGNNV